MNWNLSSGGTTRSLANLIVVTFSLSTLSAILFMFLVNRPVYDDVYNIFDVDAYAHQGVSVSTIQAQKNAPGPVSFIWMAAGVHLLEGGELRDARLAVLSSWIILVIAMLIIAPHTSYPRLWYGALLATLIFPHSLTATATLLTEGPALLFAVLGAIAWTEAVTQPSITARVFALGIAGGLALGTATISRQYYLTLLAAAFVLALFLLAHRSSHGRRLWLLTVTVSLVVAMTPVAFLMTIWRGISSPGIATGTSYQMYHAGLGLNFSRPLIAGFCVGFYLLLLTFPTMWSVPSGRKLPALAMATIIGIVSVPFRDRLVDIGVLHSLIEKASRSHALGAVVFGLIATLIAYNAIAVGLLIWEKRQVVLTCVPLIFALLTILFFVAEQLVVGGNIPFYDRYVLQLAPFLGLVAFFLIPEITVLRMVAFAAMYVLSQEMLWRHIFVK